MWPKSLGTQLTFGGHGASSWSLMAGVAISSLTTLIIQLHLDGTGVEYSPLDSGYPPSGKFPTDIYPVALV